MRNGIEEVLLLQTEYSGDNTEAMQRRGIIVRTELAGELRELLPALIARSSIDDLRVQGKDGTGMKTEIPWTRVYSHSRSPRPTGGWYVVFLFSALGDRVYLSLNQGTTRWDGAEFKKQPEDELIARTQWARSILTNGGPFPSDWTTGIKLDNQRSELGTGYEIGNVVAKEYSLDEIPDDDEIEEDLLTAIGWLGEVYRAGDEGLTVPGDSPELADIEQAIIAIAEPQRKPKGPRLTSAERRVIEKRAVTVTREHFESAALGYITKDVGDKESYDILAIKGGDTIKVEVKGTTSNGTEIVLTRNEVNLHKDNHPANALAIVRHIELHRQDDGPTATGGELHLVMPWKVNDARLEPIAYRYSTGL
ncbi:MrcB family domain-containing protein [Mycobacteroides abscessus]